MSQTMVPLSSLAPEFVNKIPQQTTPYVAPYAKPCVDNCPVACPIVASCPEPCQTVCPPMSPPACPEPCGQSGNRYTKSCTNLSYGWGWLGTLILWFIVFTVLFWLIYYSLKPAFVLQPDTNEPDTAKVLLSAVISALILVVLIWLIRFALTRVY